MFSKVNFSAVSPKPNNNNKSGRVNFGAVEMPDYIYIRIFHRIKGSINFVNAECADNYQNYAGRYTKKNISGNNVRIQAENAPNRDFDESLCRIALPYKAKIVEDDLE